MIFLALVLCLLIAPSSVLTSDTRIKPVSVDSRWWNAGDVQALQQEPFARGSFGTIYLVSFKNRIAAIKVLAASNNEWNESEALAIQELRMLQKVDSPYVIKALGHICNMRKHALILEFGGNTDLMSLYKKLPMPKKQSNTTCIASYIARCMLRALHSVHLAGMLHRDVAPGNILVSSSGELKLADFGLACLCPYGAKVSVLGAGTPFYTPKHVFMEAFVGEELDWYGLGTTLYFVYHRKEPLFGYVKNLEELKRWLSKNDKLPIDANTPSHLKDFCEVCLNDQPNVVYDKLLGLKLVDCTEQEIHAPKRFLEDITKFDTSG